MFNSPVFVLGNPRSGTTMLRLMLSCHPNIGIPPEGGFIVQLGWLYDNKKLDKATIDAFVSDFFEMETSQDWKLFEKNLIHAFEKREVANYTDMIDEIYREYFRKACPDKKIWGDKTTWYSDYLEQINSYFPSAKYIHIVRDGRSVASSYKNVPHLTSNIMQIALEWTWSLNKIHKFGKNIGAERFIQIKYEDLVVNPSQVLKDICTFLGENYHDDMVSFSEKNREQEMEPSRHLGWKGLTLSAVTSKRVSAWENELSNDELLDFYTIAMDTMNKFNYEYMEVDLPILESIKIKVKVSFYKAIRLIKVFLKPYLYKYNNSHGQKNK